MNQYDDPAFFAVYSEMPRSRDGPEAAGEWHQLRRLFPEFGGQTVLDLGCGYGWHCRYAADHGAKSVLGIDASARMIEKAQRINAHPAIVYQVDDLETCSFPAAHYDVVISNLVLHYVEDLSSVYRRIYETLHLGGVFLMNIEHPTFTAGVRQEWVDGQDGKPLYWPVDDYFYPGERETVFLGHSVKKYHHTLTQILGDLLEAGFTITTVEEAMPSKEMIPQMPEEMKRPMMLLVKAEKQRT